jgi:glycosyltransferase involved in cell wall biosynthesis
MMTHPKLRILIVAENASARFGGEAVLPLHYFTQLAARGHDLRLITHARNRDELAQTLPDLMDRVRFVPDTALHRLIWRMGVPFPGVIRDHLFGNLMGLVTAWHQRRLIRQALAERAVDVIHQPTPVSPAAPSSVHGFKTPVVIGPMNGGIDYPPDYAAMEGRAGRAFLVLGRALAGLANRVVPGKRRAAMLLVANARTRAALPLSHACVIDLVENGVDLSRWIAPARSDTPAPGLRLAFMGRLVDWKGLDITLQALAQARAARPDLPMTLDILGDGPERAKLQALGDALGLGAQLRFHGLRPQADCAGILAGLDALILGSLRECGGAVVLEAMAMGLPVIASDWGGPADYLDESCGLLVHPSPRATFAGRQAEAIVTLAADPALRARLGRAAARRVAEDFDWARKIDRIEALYSQAITGKSPWS